MKKIFILLSLMLFAVGCRGYEILEVECITDECNNADYINVEHKHYMRDVEYR